MDINRQEGASQPPYLQEMEHSEDAKRTPERPEIPATRSTFYHAVEQIRLYVGLDKAFKNMNLVAAQPACRCTRLKQVECIYQGCT